MLIVLEWIATLSGIVSVFCVALNNPKYRLFGFVLFCVCNTGWIVSGYFTDNPRLIILNLIFIMANIVGIRSCLKLLKEKKGLPI